MSRAQGCAGATQLKTPYRDGATHVVFDPLDFIARLAALVPKHRVNLTRFHGVFAPNSQHRVQVTPAQRGKGKRVNVTDGPQDRTPAERHAAMTWAAQARDIETCRECSGTVKVIACIEAPAVIEKRLTHLDETAPATETICLPESRAPAAVCLFDRSTGSNYFLFASMQTEVARGLLV